MTNKAVLNSLKVHHDVDMRLLSAHKGIVGIKGCLEAISLRVQLLYYYYFMPLLD